MSAVFYDDPNRESVGLAPIWTGAGEIAAAKASKRDAEPVPATDDDTPKAKSTKTAS
jgi:hypothetical protein